MGTCPRHNDNLKKFKLIVDGLERVKELVKEFPGGERPAGYQLVGGVMDHQGYDG